MAQDKKEKQKFEKICVLCNKPFKTYNNEYVCCYPCFKFYRQFEKIKSYNWFLEAFELQDGPEAKDEYIRFVDNLNIFKEIKGDWRVEKILENTNEFLDKVKIGEKRNK